MKEVKKFTCLKDGGEKTKGTIEGTKTQVLAWMKKTFPGIRKAADQDMMPAWQFFYRGETITYETPDGKEHYLAEVVEEDEATPGDKSNSKEEKKLEKALKDYKRNYAKRHPEWAKKEVADAKMTDEEVAAAAAKTIWATANLMPQEQADKMYDAGYIFHWRSSVDNWLAADVANRVFHDEDALKHLLCRDMDTERDDQDILMTNIHKSKFVHFQMTKAFNGGFDAYIVFRIPKSASAVVVRLCK